MNDTIQQAAYRSARLAAGAAMAGVLSLLWIVAPTPSLAEQAKRAALAPASQIVMLGTGTPLNESSRSGPAVAIVAGETAYIVDFGPGVVRQAGAAWERGTAALEPARLGVAFATHLHSDHTTGLANLSLAPWVLGRSAPLSLYGPPGIEKMAKHITEAYSVDIAARAGPLEFLPWAGAKIDAHDVMPGVILEDPDVSVEAFAVRHGSWKHAYGYRFEATDRTIVISGDTRPSDTLIAKAKGCDVLIHEAYLERALKTLDKGHRDYHGANHTSGVELGVLAAQVEPGLLIVYHTLLFGGSQSELVEEIQRNFKGRVVVANDLDLF